MAHVTAKGALTALLGFVLLAGCEFVWGAAWAIAADLPLPNSPPVTLSEDATSYVLANGVVTARVAKATGNLTSVQYKGMETLSARVGASFSQTAAGGTSVVARVTIDPKSNSGDRAEVSVKGIARRDVQSDVELRFSVGRGESGIYFYAYFDHHAEYPAVSFPESRWVCRLDDAFNWTPVKDGVMREVPPDLNGHQFLFTAPYFEQRAYGWASSKKNIGFWLINPSAEYIGGGATKTDFLTHRDNPPSPFSPCILNFWKGSHFGGGTVPIGQGEHWTKVIGPMFILCNSGPDPMTMWNDAKAQASQEAAKWPYEWVRGIEYAQRDQRTNVTGQLVLTDPLMPDAKMSNLRVGLAHAAYAPPGRGGRRGGGAAPADPVAPPVAGRGVDWQSDAKYYQFWAHAGDDGGFSIPNVIPGTYTLHAIADGVLGEFDKADITVEAGKPIDLGKLSWTPVRRGRQIWEIGVPNRNASEFAGGDTFFDPHGPLLYYKMFPNDVNFVIGKSDPGKDWFYEHVPHATDDSGQLAGNAGVTGSGRATPYNIQFDMPAAPVGQATLRVAICGTDTRQVEVSLNGKRVGQINLMGSDLVISRHGSQGIWYEREVPFDAALMKPGANVLTLTVPAGPLNNGVVYDYLRLELDESTHVPPAP